MKIELKNITVRELVEVYADKAEEGVRDYGGKLNIRPAYQREFIYGQKQRKLMDCSPRSPGKGPPWEDHKPAAV